VSGLKYSKDGLVAFDPKWHTYTRISTGKKLTSVTKYIGKYKNPFPEDAAKDYADKHGLLEQDVKDMWAAKGKQSLLIGTAVHWVFENFKLTGEIKTSGLYHKEQVAVKFINDMFLSGRLEFVETEMIVYDDEHGGQIDCVARNKKNQHFILDWKSSGEIKKEGFKGLLMLEPYDKYQDASFYHFSLQTGIYKKLCKEYPIEDCFIVHIHDTGYELIKAEEMQIMI